MNRYFFVAVSATLLWSAAHAENWVAVGSRADGTSQYLDLDSIERNLGLVEMDRVIDYASPQRTGDGKRFASQRFRTEIDCGGRAMRQAAIEWRSGAKGSGTLVTENRVPEDWAIDQFDDFTAPLWQIACESGTK